MTAFFNFIQHGGERKLYPVSGPYPTMDAAKAAQPDDARWVDERQPDSWFDAWFSGPGNETLRTIRGEYEKQEAAKANQT